VWYPDHPAQPTWSTFLDEAHEVGFGWTELGPPGFLPTDPLTLAAELGKRELAVVGGFVMEHLEDVEEHERILEHAERTSEVISRAGGSHLVVIDDMYSDLQTGAQTRSAELDRERWRHLVACAGEIGRIASANGLRAVFHPHADTHVESAAQVDSLLSGTDPLHLGLCLDTGHLAYRGDDPIEVYRRWADRTGYVHLKCVFEDAAGVVGRDGLSFVQAVQAGVFVEPAANVEQTRDIVDALISADFGGVIVIEQDLFPAPPGLAKAIAARSRRLVGELLDERALLQSPPA
jgi:sugar phosphate isomerase/epimerase